MANVIKLAEQVFSGLLGSLGNGMADRALNLYIKPVSLTAFVAGASFVGSTMWSYEANRRGNTTYFTLRGWELKQKTPVGPDTMVTSGNIVYLTICGINTVVWLAWKIPAFRPFMKKWFLTSLKMPWKYNFMYREILVVWKSQLNKAALAPWLPMFLSAFSHKALHHLASNMLFLYMFMPSSVIRKPDESQRLRVTRVEFISFYLTAAVVSKLGGLFYFTLMPYHDVTSLGASGAVCSVLGYTGTRMPDSKCFGVIPAHWVLKFFLYIEIRALILAGWNPTTTGNGNSVHVAGLLFGMLYGYCESSLDPLRDRLINIYHRYRGSSGGDGNGDS